MSTNKKRIVIVCLVIFLAFFGAGLIIHMNKPKEIEGLVYPTGTMSDSLFDSQNTTYKQDKDLSATYAFSHIPYTVDTYPDIDGAIVDTGCIFPIKDSSYLFYFSEIPKDADFFHTIKKQYGTGVLYKYDPELSYIEDIYVQNGFINGFSGSYTISKFVMNDGKEQKNSYLFGYYLSIPNYDYNMLISVGTNIESSQAFDTAKKILDKLVFTIRFDSSKERRLLDEASKNTESSNAISEKNMSSEYGVSDVDASSNTQNTSKVEIYDQSTDTSTYTSVTVGNSQQVGRNVVGDMSGQNYATFLSATDDDMVCNVYWEGDNLLDIEVVCSPADTVYQTDKIVDGIAQFYVGPLVDGEYVIYVLADSTTSLKAEMVNNATGEVTPLSLITISQN